MALAPTTIIAQDRQGAWSERSFAGEPRSPWRALAHGLLVPPGRRSRRFKYQVGRALKWTVRGLYLAPGLVLAVIIMRVGDLPGGEVLTAAFVCLVVLFFALLNLYVVAAAIAQRIGQRGKSTLQLPFTKTGADALGLLAVATTEVPRQDQAPAELDSVIRVRGTVAELTPRVARGQPLVRDLWLPEGAPPARLTEVVAFAVLGADKLPVIVTQASAPTLILPPQRGELASALASFGEATVQAYDQHVRTAQTADDAAAWSLVLREGDEVELVGVVIDQADDVQRLQLGDAERAVPATGAGGVTSPYRHGKRRHGLIVGALPHQPVVIRRLASA